LDIRIKVLSGRKKNGNIEVTVRSGPVNWQTLIVILSVNKFGIGLQIVSFIS